MKMSRFSLALFLVLITSGPGRAAEEPHVLLITIDGFPARMFWDEKAPLPHLRQLAAEGVAADGMHICNPTVTWPNHTTLITGDQPAKHSVLYNGILSRNRPGVPVKIDPRKEQRELVAVPTLFDLFHKNGLRTAAINWPCTRNAASIDDNFPDVPENVRYTTPKLRAELVAEKILADETDASFSKLTGPGRDAVWTQAACQVIRERKPQFMVLHLLNTDGTHHRYGPETPASHTALALADFYVGQVLDSLEAAGIRSNTTVFVVADHGFATATNLIQPNVLLRQQRLLQTGTANQITEARVQVVSEGGTGMIFLTDPATREADRKQVIELFSGREGVADIIEPKDYAALGLPSPEKNPGMSDLLLAARDGYGVSGSAEGEDFVVPVTGNTSRGYHGYVASNPKMNALFIAAGRGIKRGVKVGIVENIDVAPTIAHLLGQKFAETDGKILTEICAKPE